MSGLVKPQKGQILVDENELKDEEIKSWQNKISIITQDFNLLFENIYENFEINLKENKKEKIQKILKDLNLAQINEEIDSLSKGQKQIIALLAQLYQEKEILILDEITSSLDVISEDKINELLKNYKNKKTVILIAHRLQILKNCTKVIYMDNGKIIDFDTFENLNNKYENFKKIIELSSFKLT